MPAAIVKARLAMSFSGAWAKKDDVIKTLICVVIVVVFVVLVRNFVGAPLSSEDGEIYAMSSSRRACSKHPPTG